MSYKQLLHSLLITVFWIFSQPDAILANCEDNYVEFKWGNDFLVPEGLDRFLSNYNSLSHASCEEIWTFRNEMHTPDDLRGSPVQSMDHPWDGITLLDYTRRHHIGVHEERRLGIGLGVAGRGSGSAELQRFVHGLGFGARPTYQPTNPSEPLLNLSYRHIDRSTIDALWGISKLTTTYGADVGNYKTQAILSQDLRRGFKHFYGVAGIEGRALLYSTVLDGRLFHKNEYTVSRIPFVAVGSLGIGTDLSPFVLELKYRFFTEQFESQVGRHTVAELTIRYNI